MAEVIVNAGAEMVSGLVTNMSLSVGAPIRVVERYQGKLALNNREAAERVVAYLHEYGFSEAKIEEEE